jgi:hypothetical protein
MHRSRINGLLIDCNTDDIDAAAQFWAHDPAIAATARE